jgi:signal transduction histidine kinase
MDYQLLFEESPDVLLVLLPDSPRFTAVAATKARLESTHSTKEQTIGRGLFEMFPDNPDDAAADGTRKLRASLERVLASKAADTMAVQKYDIPLPTGGFEVKYWSPRNIPILSPQGEVQFILHRAVDVTELVRAGELGQELRGRTQDMERDVLRRSRELDDANRQLREANSKLNQLDAAKTAFFNNISHEFRTPLTLMLGPLADCLADSSQPWSESQRASLRLAHDNAVRLLKLVNSLLDFSRLEAGRMRGRFAPVDLAASTAELAAMFESAIESAGLRMTVDCPALSTPLWIDASMWEKIIPNLLSNAFKFTLDGEIRVRLHETPTHARVEVSDTGVGIPESELPRIFERFHRVAGATGRTHEGAGIGLALVRELVELHGGSVHVESRLGKGTTFRIEIPKGCSHLPPDCLQQNAAATDTAPLSNAHAIEAQRWIERRAPAEDAQPDVALPGTTQTGTLQHATATAGTAQGAAKLDLVLVVDDNNELRDYMRNLLAPYYRVVTAADGVAAVQMLRDCRPAIIVSDVMMPRMNGIELVQAVRADPQTVAIPIILLSARAGGEATIEGLEAGCDDYLTKPFTAQELLARVRSHVQLANSRSRWAAALERANRELDAFSYSVAHDLRAPLRLIEGFGAMLADENSGQLDAEGCRRLGMIRDSAKRMSQLIDDLLYLSRLDRSQLNRANFNLSMLVRSVAAQIQGQQPARKVSIEVEEDLVVQADPNLLKIALENLLGNAWKFTSKRSAATIQFGVMYEGEPVYYIRDNGAGFDMRYASKLFGVFQRLHADSDFHGTGIGLATVERIMLKHGGRVWANGEVDQGATFYFTLGVNTLGTTTRGGSPSAAARAAA